MGDHRYSVFNQPFPKSSYAYLNTTANDFNSRTWEVKHHTCSAAAGKVSFHHNVAKPQGAVRANAASGSFERQGPLPKPAISAANTMLGNSYSAPTLNIQQDRIGTARSERSQRSNRSCTSSKRYALQGA